jgi:hypothetical protein
MDAVIGIALFLTPFVIGLKYGPRIMRANRRRQMETAIWKGKYDQTAINDAIKHMRKNGRI